MILFYNGALLSDISFVNTVHIMSYSFLLKYIIIGDSGTPIFTQASESLACFSNTPTKDTARNTKSRSEYSSEQKCLKLNKIMSSFKYGIQ